MSSSDEYQPWPEQACPMKHRDCNKCELERQRKQVIWGEGNPDGRLLAILDNPGAREDAAGKQFVCATRRTLHDGLRTVGLSSEDVFLTFLLKCRPIRAYDKLSCRTTCLNYLEEQIASGAQQAILCLGDTVVQNLLDPAANVRSLRGRWLPDKLNVPVRVTYHPLAIYRRPNLLPLFLEDLGEVAKLLKTHR